MYPNSVMVGRMSKVANHNEVLPPRIGALTLIYLCINRQIQ